jgi:aldehyde:ferredoxin oxidoreductase
MLGAATGWDVTLSDLLRTGERIVNLKRALNLRWGLSPGQENLPGLLLKPLEEGGTAGYVPDVDRLLSDYYGVRQWERATGKPSEEKLLALGLEEAAVELY